MNINIRRFHSRIRTLKYCLKNIDKAEIFYIDIIEWRISIRVHVSDISEMKSKVEKRNTGEIGHLGHLDHLTSCF